MSQAPSPSTGKRYGLKRACRIWRLARLSQSSHENSGVMLVTRTSPERFNQPESTWRPSI